MKITLAPTAMSMFDRLFKSKKERKKPARSAKTSTAQAEPPAREREPAPESQPVASQPADDRTPEERCGIMAGMDKEAIRTQLAKMFRRYNRLASSLDGDSRTEAEAMLDTIVALREKHLG